jgi:predicted dehydrogenase
MALRWGLLSTARINDAFLAGIADLPSAEVVAVASRDAGRARDYAQAHDIASAHGSDEALFADRAVEIASANSPRLEAEDLAAVVAGGAGGGGLGREDAIGQARALGMLHDAAL